MRRFDSIRLRAPVSREKLPAVDEELLIPHDPDGRPVTTSISRLAKLDLRPEQTLFNGRYVIRKPPWTKSNSIAIPVRDLERHGQHTIIKLFWNTAHNWNPLATGEARILEALGYPLSPSLIACGNAGEVHPFIVMSDVGEESLYSYPRNISSPEQKVRLLYILRAATALNRIGQLIPGFVHGDIKPENIVRRSLRGQRPWATIIDFSFSTWDNDTYAFGACGTLEYLPPERARARLEIEPYYTHNPSADVFALGLILYEIYTGSDPPDRTAIKLGRDAYYYKRGLEWDAHDFKRLLQQTSASMPLRDLISRCLSIQIERRPTIAELAQVLEKECAPFDPWRKAP